MMNYKERLLLKALREMASTQRQLIETLAEYMDSGEKDAVTEDKGNRAYVPVGIIPETQLYVPLSFVGTASDPIPAGGTNTCSSPASDTSNKSSEEDIPSPSNKHLYYTTIPACDIPF